MLRMEQNVNRSEVHLGVGAYDNNEWRLVKIDQ
jgi:hypothetical protein